MSTLFLFGALLFGALVVIAATIIFRFAYWRRLLRQSLRLRLLRVRFPAPFEKKDSKEALAEVAAFSQLIALLGTRKGTAAFEVAVHALGESIFFYVAVPEEDTEFIARQIQGLWADAQIERVPDYTVFNAKGSVAAAYFKMKKGRSLPLRTFEEASLDTFSAIVSSFSKLQTAGEGLALQILVKPAPKVAKKNIVGRIVAAKKGEKIDKKDPQSQRIIDEDTIKLLEKKIAKPLFAVNVRAVAAAATAERSKELLGSLAGSFAQFSSPLHNEFSVESPKNIKPLAFQFCFRMFNPTYELFLNADEVASIYHFPTAATAIPRIEIGR